MPDGTTKDFAFSVSGKSKGGDVRKLKDVVISTLDKLWRYALGPKDQKEIGLDPTKDGQKIG